MKLTKEAAERLEAYFADDPSPEVVASMEAWLREDEANPRLLAEYGLLDRLISHEQKNQDASAIFASLLEAEEAAVPIVLNQPALAAAELDRKASDSISFKQACAALSYLAKQSLRTKTTPIISIAAVLVLAVVLAIVLRGGQIGDTQSVDPIAEDNTPATTIEAPAVVATLTNTRDAQWAQASLAPGSELHPGTRFTLTAGFAEITTYRGAIAVLEAPASIEFTDNDNALRLHTGKLVGICETPSSKGFVVQTPHMDITDLGTRFGVDAGGKETFAHVFDGEVEAARPGVSNEIEPFILMEGQSAKTSIDSDVIVTSDTGAERFASILPNIESLLTSTGQGLAVGDIDTAWRIVEIGGQALETPVSLAVFDDVPTRTFGPQDAKWIGVKTSDYQWKQREARYTIQTQVEISDERELGFATLLLRFHPDDEASSLIVNGEAIDLPDNYVMKGHIYEVRITDGLVHGSNDVKLEITDRRPVHDQENYIGIRASWYLVTRQTPFEGGAPTP